MLRYEKPAPLPQVDGIEVFALGRHTSAAESPIFSLRPSAVFVVTATVKADELLTRHIAELWRELPAGRQARCHVPPFALRFFADGELILEASLCWQCNNIWMREGETFSVYEFDGRAEVSRELLAVLKAVSEVEEMER